MNTAVHLWMQRASTVPGVLAGAVRSPDSSLVAQSFYGKLPIPRLQNAARDIMDIVQALGESRIGTDRLRWTFEKGRVHCTARADGAMAALLVMPEMDLSPEVDGLLSDFMSLQC